MKCLSNSIRGGIDAASLTFEERPLDPSDEPRRLNLLDLVALVAGCAAGLALGRYYIASGTHRHYNWGSEPLAVAEGWGVSLGVSLTLTYLALRARRPRPALRGLVRQPGFVAGWW